MHVEGHTFPAQPSFWGQCHARHGRSVHRPGPSLHMVPLRCRRHFEEGVGWARAPHSRWGKFPKSWLCENSGPSSNHPAVTTATPPPFVQHLAPSAHSPTPGLRSGQCLRWSLRLPLVWALLLHRGRKRERQRRKARGGGEDKETRGEERRKRKRGGGAGRKGAGEQEGRKRKGEEEGVIGKSGQWKEGGRGLGRTEERKTWGSSQEEASKRDRSVQTRPGHHEGPAGHKGLQGLAEARLGLL